jgi:predicted dehydrogenase
MNVLIVGNGSIGKQHVSALLTLGVKPIVYTQFPDVNSNVKYIKSLNEINDVDIAIICSPTGRHLLDFKRITSKFKLSKVLIEKPVATSTQEALEIKKISIDKRIKVYVAFDMRFISKLQYIKRNIQKLIPEIKLVKIYCGQYLPEWRPESDYRKSYSSFPEKGGGVDLDLTHEIDYMLWLFGSPQKIEYTKIDKISSLEISSPDYFKGIYKYNNFIVDVELDYIRKLDRKLIILGENKVLVNLDFIKDNLIFCNEKVELMTNDIKNSLSAELHEFLNEDNPCNLCALDESIEVLKMINK